MDMLWSLHPGSPARLLSGRVVTAGLICIWEARPLQTAWLMQGAFLRGLPWPAGLPPSPSCSPALGTWVHYNSSPCEAWAVRAHVTGSPPARPTTLRLAHTVFTRWVFVVWGFFFSFRSLQLLVLKPPALRQLSQKESERERKGERIKVRDDKMTFCKSCMTFERPPGQSWAHVAFTRVP